MIDDFILSIIGIAVSVILFLIGYKKTVGAKNERIKSANIEIERILVRRIVLENYQPQKNDINRFIDGKSRDFQLSPSDLLNEYNLLNNIFTRILESDFIPMDQRVEIILRLEPLFIEFENERIDFNFNFQRNSKIKLSKTTALVIVLALMTSLIGAFIISIPEFRAIDYELEQILPLALYTIIGSLFIISLLMILLKLKQVQNTSDEINNPYSSYLKLKKDLVIWAKKYKYEISKHPKEEEGYDYIISKNDLKILIQIQIWSGTPHRLLLSRIIGLLNERIQATNATFAVIATSDEIQIPNNIKSNDRIKFMSANQLEKYLARN